MFSLFRRSAPQPEPSPEPAPKLEGLSGYEASLLVDVVFAKTKALRREDVPLQTGTERTMLSVLLAERLTRANPLRVLDFGGACGFHHMAADLLNVPLRWAVVETPAMVEKANVLSSESLRFFADIVDAMQWIGSVDLMFSSSALQYLVDPIAYLRKLVALRAPLMVWSRLPMTDGDARREVQTSQLADNGPGPMPSQFEDREVHYSRTILSRPEFTAAHDGYKLLWRSGDAGSAGFVFLREDLSL